MGLSSRKPQPEPAPPSRRDWSNIESIRGEWPLASLDRAADMQKYQQALALFKRDDYPAMMQCATMFATALAHSLYGDGLLHGDDLPNTVHKTLYCSLCAPPDGQTFADGAQRAARLAMTIMRENGWQPPAFGGTNKFFEPMMMDTGNRMLLGAAVAPPYQPWAGDLNAFFAVPPTPLVSTLPDPAASQGSDAIDRMHDTLQQAEAGDAASKYHTEGMSLLFNGDAEGALAKLSEAAKLGSVDAMATAGDITRDLGRHDESRFWYETAAGAGHPVAMYNVAILAVQAGQRTAAAQWFQKAADTGNAEGYAALTQLASEAGDEAAESHWARLGAEAGHTFCMARHGLLLARGANGDWPTLRRARDFLEQAAERGNIDAMGLAVSVNQQLGDPARGRRFVDMIVQTGNNEAIDRLRRHGLL
jgi:TPR repeat protein